MKKNMGSLDRLLRTVLAIVVIVLMLTGTISGWLGIVLGIVAVIFLVTSAIGSCPLYSAFGWATGPRKEAAG